MNKQNAGDRSVLPLPHRDYVGLTPYDAKDPDCEFLTVEKLRPPIGAPNVVVIMLDDVGFGASSTFGGACKTPVFDRLAVNGRGGETSVSRDHSPEGGMFKGRVEWVELSDAEDGSDHLLSFEHRWRAVLASH